MRYRSFRCIFLCYCIKLFHFSCYRATDYNTPEMIAAAEKIQKMYENYTTQDAIGGKYENAANNFLSGQDVYKRQFLS